MSTYRVGIVGLSGIAAAPPAVALWGSWAQEVPHAHRVQLARSAGTCVVAVCDLVPKLLEDFTPRRAAPGLATATYSRHRQMLAQESADQPQDSGPPGSDQRHADIVWTP